MSPRIAGRAILLGATTMVMAGAPLLAQVPAQCSYDACALSIVPHFGGLDVVRGSGEQRVGTLGFLVPRDVHDVFAGSVAAQAHARTAFSIRRVAAVLTDLGGAVAVAGAVNAMSHPRDRRTPVYLCLGGAVLIGASVMPQFAADAELSRAVREYNRQFSK